MAMSKGGSIPSASFFKMGKDGPEVITTEDIFKNRKVVLVAVPGAFTPTCTNTHLPGFVAHADDILAKGVDTIACLAVNDVFVMSAWGEQLKAEKLLMLADGSGEFTRAMGMELDLSARGLGVRSDRYAMVAENEKVTFIAHEAPGKLEISTAEEVLGIL